ncbi:unnamed protein product [Absidia cylindrospora]
MLRNITSRLAKTGARRAYSSGKPTQHEGSKTTHNLAEEALAQKTGGQFKATLPKGDKKPAKAAGSKENHWKSIAIGTGATTGVLIGGLFYYGRPFADNREDKYVSENLLSASYHRSLNRFREFRQEMHQPMWD